MTDLAQLLPPEVSVNLFFAVSEHLRVTHQTHLPLNELPAIYEKIIGKPLPVSLAFVNNGVFDHVIRLSVPATGHVVISPYPLEDPNPAAIVKLHEAKLAQLIEIQNMVSSSRDSQQAARIAQKEKDTQILLRGVHEVLISSGGACIACNEQELGVLIHQLFMNKWKVPLSVQKIGFDSVVEFLREFPLVVTVSISSGSLTVTAEEHPDFTVGGTVFNPNRTSTLMSRPKPHQVDVQVAQQIDSVRASIAGLKIDLLESAKDHERVGRLHARLAAKQQQLVDLLTSAQLIPC